MELCERRSNEIERSITAMCEALEERRLFTAFQLLIDGNPVNGPTTKDYGTVVQGSTGPSHSFGFKYLGDGSLSISAELGNATNAFALASGDEGPVTLSKNQTMTVSYRLLTEFAAQRQTTLNFNFRKTTPRRKSTHTLIGTIIPSNVGGAEDLGSMTNSTVNKNGVVKSKSRQDGEGNTLEQSQPYLAKFELPAVQSRMNFQLSGLSMPFNGNQLTSGKLGVIITKDANGDGVMSVAEREDSNAVRFTTDQIGPCAMLTKSANKTLSSGKYPLFIYTVSVQPDFSTNDPSTDLGFNSVLKVDHVAPPAFEVAGQHRHREQRHDARRIGPERALPT